MSDPSSDLPSSAADSPVPFRSSVLFGTLCGLVAAFGYTCANICLRSVSDCDPVWVSAVKSVPTVLLAAPIVCWEAWGRGQQVVTRRAALALAISGLLGQLGGNVLFQWSLGVVGLALAVPLCLGGQIISSGLLGRIVLGEAVSARRAMAIGVLIVATVVLSSGADAAHRTVAPSADASASFGELAAGVAAATFSGLAYAILGVVIRRAVVGQTTIAATLFVVCVVGLISLGAWSPLRLGWDPLWATPWADLRPMLLAGLFNFAAFWALTKALQLTPVVYVNALNVTQASLAAMAGVLLFQEAPSAGLVWGVVLTAAGLLLLRGR
ncbi:MAG: DMT family transporter [Pirellulales bacterium]